MHYWKDQAEIPAKQILGWMKVPEGTFYKWRERYGKVNEHNGWIPREVTDLSTYGSRFKNTDKMWRENGCIHINNYSMITP